MINDEIGNKGVVRGACVKGLNKKWMGGELK